MVKKVKKHEAQTKEGRRKERQELGSLRSLTVQPKTKARYQQGLDRFFEYLASEGLQLPKKRDHMDDVVSDYLEYLWSDGEGRAVANNFMAALQDFDPKLKGALPGSWRLLKTWTTHEVPNRAPPLTESLINAMAGWAFFNEKLSFGLSLLLAFHGLLRTGELLSLQAHHFHILSPVEPAVISLGLTKSGKRQGAAESVTLTDKNVLKILWAWKQSASPHAFLTEKPHRWRQTFNECLDSLKLQEWSFRPYSLRRGGATTLFLKTNSLDKVLLAGRWTAVKTAKIYLNSGLAMLADITFPVRSLSHFHLVYANFLKSTPKFEPAVKHSRTGGRGKKRKISKKR